MLGSTYQDIVNAINIATVCGGGVVSFPNRTYECDGNVIIFGDNLTVNLNGSILNDARVVLDGDNITLQNGTLYAAVDDFPLRLTGDNLTIRDLVSIDEADPNAAQVVMQFASNVTLDNLITQGRAEIWIEDSHHVTIENSELNHGTGKDDAIALKCSSFDTHDITVRNCTINGAESMLAFGGEVADDCEIYNIVFENCTGQDVNFMLACKPGDEPGAYSGTVRDVTISNISVDSQAFEAVIKLQANQDAIVQDLEINGVVVTGRGVDNSSYVVRIIPIGDTHGPGVPTIQRVTIDNLQFTDRGESGYPMEFGVFSSIQAAGTIADIVIDAWLTGVLTNVNIIDGDVTVNLH